MSSVDFNKDKKEFWGSIRSQYVPVLLFKLSDNANAMRSESIDGYGTPLHRLKIGQEIEIFAATMGAPYSCAPCGHRYFQSSAVKLIIKRSEKEIVVETVNSKYMLLYKDFPSRKDKS